MFPVGRVFPVVIVGAGPTGLTAASLLAEHGVESVVLERRQGVYPLPRAVHLDDEVWRILQNAGAAEEFGPHGRAAKGMHLVDARMRVLMEFTRERAEGHHGWRESTMFDQPDLERVLRSVVSRKPQITLREGVDVDSISVDGDDGATVTIRGEAGLDTLRARYVLGCDGTSSSVAAAIGGGARDLHFSQRWLVVDVRCAHDLDLWPGVHQVCAGAQSSTFMRIGDDRYRWEFRLANTADVDPGEEWALREVRRHLPPDAADVEVLRIATYRHAARIARRWRSGPLFVLGDAAHVTPPFIGQGLGAGQRDAMNLAWKLAAVLQGTADDGLLDTYQSERAPHVRRAVIAATVVGRLMGSRPAPVRSLVHGVMCGLDASPGADKVGPKFIDPRVGRAALPVRERILPSHRIVGTMVPQFTGCRGSDGSGPDRSDDVLGDGYVLLTDCEPAAALRARADAVSARHVQVTELRGAAEKMRAWLRGRHVRAVLIRPDRVVTAAR